MLLDLLPWVAFLAFVGAMLGVDLGIFNRKAHSPSRREAVAWSAVWIGVAVLFNIGVYWLSGADRGLEWTTGYLIEKSLAVDNIFVFLLIFATFQVPQAYQHRVLFWGIVGALVLRAALIAFAGILITTLSWIIYVFGAFLVITGIKFLRDDEHTPELEHNWLVRIARRFVRVTPGYEGQKLFTRTNGMIYATPLFLVLLLVESSDLFFAVDSIPAIYAITDDPFVVFTSNILAILGLRSLYFVLAGYLAGLRYLKPALSAVLVFVGLKMLAHDLIHFSPLASLGIIIAILTAAVIASLLRPKPLAPEVASAIETAAPS